MYANLARQEGLIFELARPLNWFGGLGNRTITASFLNIRGGGRGRAPPSSRLSLLPNCATWVVDFSETKRRSLPLGSIGNVAAFYEVWSCFSGGMVGSASGVSEENLMGPGEI